MPNKKYNRGANFERAVMKYLESKGFLCFRTAGSHGLVDVIAVPKLYGITTLPKLIQCKTNGQITNKDLLELKKTSCEYNGIFLIAEKQKGKIPLFKNLYGDSIEL